MNCERIREQIPEVLAGRLDKNTREQLVEHLESCAACRTEMAELNGVERAEALKSEPDEAPQGAAKARFQEDSGHTRRAWRHRKLPKKAAAESGRVPCRPVWKMAIAAGLLAAGIFAGRSCPRPARQQPEMAQLRGQVEGLRQMVALFDAAGHPPSARMRGSPASRFAAG